MDFRLLLNLAVCWDKKSSNPTERLLDELMEPLLEYLKQPRLERYSVVHLVVGSDMSNALISDWNCDCKSVLPKESLRWLEKLTALNWELPTDALRHLDSR